ncbi:MAG TPA: hypothetical protein VJN94_17840 [Candidatus Binataceae bacterium]|nr:hypothetical protein [Candidatus Binataceae bacterium]
MYELEDLLRELREALRKDDFGAMQESVRRAVGAKPLTAEIGASRLLHSEPGLTVLHTAVNAGFESPPHDHRTWAVIGVYDGQEDNAFYRLIGDSRVIEECGGRSLCAKDVMMLGPNAIHKIANPRESKLIALHVYGQNIFEIERSAWAPATGLERPFNLRLDARGVVRS